MCSVLYYHLYMNEEELRYLFTDRVSNTKIGTTPTTNRGTAHNLWLILDRLLPPVYPWAELPPAARKLCVNAGNQLHAAGIPYAFYAQALSRFRLGRMKRYPLSILASGVKKSGRKHILQEYLDLMRLAQDCWVTNPQIIKVNDSVYTKYPEAYAHGMLAYMHGMHLLREAFTADTSVIAAVYSQAVHATSAERFWEEVGHVVHHTATTHAPEVKAIMLDAGYSNQVDLVELQQEMKIRLGRVPGTPNPVYNKYFKKTGALSVAGIGVITGKTTLGAVHHNG